MLRVCLYVIVPVQRMCSIVCSLTVAFSNFILTFYLLATTLLVVYLGGNPAHRKIPLLQIPIEFIWDLV